MNDHDAYMDMPCKSRRLLNPLALTPFLAVLLSCGLTGQMMPKGAIVLKPSEIPGMLAQCSRSAPAKGEGSWTPTAKDVLALEAKLPPALKNAQPNEDWKGFPSKWQRQFVGIVRGRQHFIYGSYAPIDIDWPLSDQAMRVCDGGPVFFGAEYQIETGKITHLAFNGSV
ncbi:hypothetical protein MOK15_06935 [Sphingobium sp. BYY-5]|uniref:hypothetical protein n=1 Tax=Sphingobium sp. BYY-5 TaxID=2926400 RepID=UPI001FA70B81|nr:hypothetical protein [Sphingobium sp. BYY-5]MCI4589823.1 hypothetical protein [Sphingobium sp. BYY-5]